MRYDLPGPVQFVNHGAGTINAPTIRYPKKMKYQRTYNRIVTDSRGTPCIDYITIERQTTDMSSAGWRIVSEVKVLEKIMTLWEKEDDDSGS
jgi:hypothetical protein